MSPDATVVPRLPRTWLLICFLSLAWLAPCPAATLDEAQKLYNTGEYDDCTAACAAAIEQNQWHMAWRLLKIRSELASGRYSDALATYEAAMSRYNVSIPLRLLGYEVLRRNDRPQEAQVLLRSIRELAAREPWRYSDGESRVALGRALVQAGADARQCLELFFDPVKKAYPTSADPHLAAGQLALDKHDYALAAESFAEAAKRAPEDPEVYFGLARAYSTDRQRAAEALTKALELNSRHVESLLFQVDDAIDAEEHPRAEALIKQVLAVNPQHARAWAYRAVLAHLAGDKEKEASHREAALKSWKTNPEVDHTIGRKLSQEYRFKEGAAYQRKALAMDADYRPAKVQLCQDLLRLGQEEEGWQLAAKVFEEDQYNVVAYNLATLHDNLAKFKTLETPDFLVRMDDREARIYGTRVLALLARARQTLCKKYDVELAEPITVEIFPQQKDFAIRTFGLPGGAGFLGVCFGPVITANSPASQGESPSNWEAVLWHEFCHVVTLHKTGNKLPRWLSEGISVYEERQENASWGQVMTPVYREMVLKGEFHPVSQLSGAFLKPDSPLHLQFAYYHSSMVVEYLIGRYGPLAMQRMLTDLGQSIPINQALSRHSVAVAELDKDFAAWFRKQAEALAPEADWARPELAATADSAAWAKWNDEHPNSFWGLLAEGRALVSERKWKQAIEPLQQAAALYEGSGADSPYRLLAVAHRELGETQAERSVLEKLVARDDEAGAARLRLAELAAEKKEWKAVVEHATQAIAINPLVPAPHRHLAAAAEAAGERAAAIEAQRALLVLDPLDLAETHFRLARLLHEEGKTAEARRHVLQSLEQAPRYLEAHRLLLEIVGQEKSSTR
jgi:tetratricopeptide (TPR) repeat protein